MNITGRLSIRGWNRNPHNVGLVEQAGLFLRQDSYSESDAMKDILDRENLYETIIGKNYGIQIAKKAFENSA
jgi:hypothetical protein